MLFYGLSGLIMHQVLSKRLQLLLALDQQATLIFPCCFANFGLN